MLPCYDDTVYEISYLTKTARFDEVCIPRLWGRQGMGILCYFYCYFSSTTTLLYFYLRLHIMLDTTSNFFEIPHTHTRVTFTLVMRVCCVWGGRYVIQHGRY